MAFLLGFIGLFVNPFLTFVALFVWIGASQEAGMVQMKSALDGIPVSRAMVTEFRSLSADDPLSRAVDLVLTGSQQDFPVTEETSEVSSQAVNAQNIHRFFTIAQATFFLRGGSSWISAHSVGFLFWSDFK